MNRKFKVWDSAEKRWSLLRDWAITINGDLIQVEEYEYVTTINPCNDDFTPAFSTGQTDKNGVEIYDGDIWKRDTFIAVVTFENSGWNLPKTESSGCYQYPSFYSNASTGEIIGNKYQNPELLENHET